MEHVGNNRKLNKNVPPTPIPKNLKEKLKINAL
jgi:hypothetical protein